FYTHSHHPNLHSFPHDALPICQTAPNRHKRDLATFATHHALHSGGEAGCDSMEGGMANMIAEAVAEKRRVFEGPPAIELRDVTKDRKSTRLNSSHVKISYAVFC